MKREELHHLRSGVLESMGFVLVYAPDFPPDDHTDLGQIRKRLLSQLAQHRVALRTEEQLTWQRLCEQETASAFDAFASGDTATGRSVIQRAEQHFRQSFKPKHIRPGFVVGADGQAIKT